MSKVIQILETFSYGDAIGNHALAIHKSLIENKIESYIYASNIDPRLKKYARHIDNYENNEKDTILYHLSSGNDLNKKLETYNGRKIINYHNITPPEFLEPYNKKISEVSRKGYEDIKNLSLKVDMAITDSEYNANELKRMGYQCRIETIPIIIKFDDYDKEASSTIVKKYKSDGYKNIVFIGRIAPNKKQEDIIKDFYYYAKYYNNKSRLFLVGNFNNFESYFLKLKKYVSKLGLKNVYFTGHISFADILAYYQIADIFLCESEHEGFCVPLVEAMKFGVPIIAYDSSAVGETLGNAGILIKKKDPKFVANLIDFVCKDEKLKELIQINEQKRLDYFSSKKHIEKLIDIIANKQ